MCIYCGTNNYRKIYENHIGSIPRDQYGRTYDIHHIDGDRSNNTPENLVALTIQEHYDLHEKQSDWYACWKLAGKMKKTPVETSEMARLAALQQIKDGKNKFVGESGSLLSKEVQQRQIEAGTHCLLSGNIQRAYHKTALADGSHQSQVTWSCVNCGLSGKSKSNYTRHKKFCLSESRNAGQSFCWENIKSGERICLTGHEFIKKFEAAASSVYRLIRGISNSKSVSGWRIVE
jgi:hypothetical protein